MHHICSSDSFNNPNASESMSEIAIHPWRANETTFSNRAYGAQQGASGSYNTASSGRNSQSRIRCEVATACEGDYDNLSRSRLYQSATDKSILSRVDEEPAQNLRQHEHEIPEEASNRCETGKKRDDMGTMCKELPPAFRLLYDIHAKEGEPLIETTRQNKTPITSTCEDELQTLQALQRRIDQKMRSLEEEINSIHSKLNSVKKTINECKANITWRRAILDEINTKIVQNHGIHHNYPYGDKASQCKSNEQMQIDAITKDLFEFYSFLCKNLEKCKEIRMLLEDQFDQIIIAYKTSVNSRIPYNNSYWV